jgi:hypothetical protein
MNQLTQPPAPRFLSLKAKLATSLLFIFWAVAGSWATCLSSHYFAATLASQRFTATPCTITSSRIIETSPYRLDVHYTYTINNQAHSGSLVEDGYDGADDYYKAQALYFRYPPGFPATCFVDPADPAHAILQRRSLWAALVPLMFLSFAVVGVGGLYLLWRPARAASLSPAISRLRKLRLEVIAPLVLGGTCLAVGFIPVMKRGLAGQSWPRVPCAIAAARVVPLKGRTSYNAAVLFHYTVNGRRYGSSRYALEDTSADFSEKQQIVRDLLAHRDTTCFVNPADPADAVLTRDYRAAAVLTGSVSSVFLLVGVAALFIPRLGRRAYRDTLLRAPGPRGPAELKQPLPPVLKAAGLAALALLWQAMLALLIAIVVSKSYSAPRPFMLVITAGLAAGGLALIVKAVRAFFLPAARVQLDPHPLRPGQPAQLRWHFPAHPDRVRRLKLCAARIDAPPGQIGIPSLRRTTPAWYSVLLDTTSSPLIRDGHCTLRIPPDALVPPPRPGLTYWVILLDADNHARSPTQQEFFFQVESLESVRGAEPQLAEVGQDRAP